MILTEAKKRAQQEFERVLEQTELSPDQVRQYEAQRPATKKITYPIPHEDVAGTAAGYVLHLAGKL